MRLSVETPVVTMQPGHPEWEATGTIDDVARIAEIADRLGYDHLTCCEHIAVPGYQAGRRGVRYWDPLATLGYLAARTRSIRLATNVLVLGYHHPLELAKQYGTLDVVSNGRVILGVGVGTLKEEFDLLEAPFEDRGARGNDAIRALRAALSKREPTYRGEYYSFGDLVVEPCAVQEKLPIWVGGRTLRSLRRAVDLADGWCPFGITVEQAQEWLGRVNIPAGFEVVLRPDDLFDPIAKPQVTADALGRLAAAGTTIAVAQVVHQSLEHYLEQLDALTAINART